MEFTSLLFLSSVSGGWKRNLRKMVRALKDCDGDNILSPDGFNLSFIKAGWDFLKEDFFNMFSEFHRRCKLNMEVNATFLTLIAKVSDSAKVREYKPITLVGCVYKLISKVLKNHVHEVLQGMKLSIPRCICRK